MKKFQTSTPALNDVVCASAAKLFGIYNASKHAVIGLTKAAALEFSAQAIRVNAVNPAVIDTEMVDRLADGMNVKKDDLSTFHPIGRLGRVEEVAEAVCGYVPIRHRCDGAQYDGGQRIHSALSTIQKKTRRLQYFPR